MTSPRYKIHISDDVVDGAMANGSVLFGIKASRAKNKEHFGHLLDRKIDSIIESSVVEGLSEAQNIIQGIRDGSAYVVDSRRLTKYIHNYCTLDCPSCYLKSMCPKSWKEIKSNPDLNNRMGSVIVSNDLADKMIEIEENCIESHIAYLRGLIDK